MPRAAADVLKELKSGKYQPLYFLQGDEPYYIDAICHYIEQHGIAEHERGFNQVVLYGKDMDMARILTQARRFPMMAERQVVIVREAQEISNLNQAVGQQLLESYAKSIVPSTILVFAHKNKTLDGRKGLAKVLDKEGYLIVADKVKDSALAGWISQEAKERQLQVQPEAVQLLAEYIGTDLSRISNELEKLSVNVPAGQAVSPAMVEQFVGFSREFTIWELQRVLGQRQLAKAVRIVRYFAADPKGHPIIPMIAALFNFFSKVLIAHSLPDKSERGLASGLGINPYQARDYTSAMRTFSPQHLTYIIHQIRLADGRSKGLDAGIINDQGIMEELVAAICGVQ